MEIGLKKHIDKRRKEAEILLERVVARIDVLGIDKKDTFARIKSESSIYEKILFFQNKPEYRNMSLVEVLDVIPDIAAVTIVSRNLAAAVDLYRTFTPLFATKEFSFVRAMDRIRHKENYSTGYNAILAYFEYKNIPFEIQFTDDVNLKLRNDTHAAFRNQKYASVREHKR